LGEDLYVADDYVRIIYSDGTQVLTDDSNVSGDKRILISKNKSIIQAFEGEKLIMEFPVSLGISSTPTPHGEFKIFKKMPSRYMQGPIPGGTEDEYDLPGVPWVMYFTHKGAAIHGAYWHNDFGRPHSHGCVNLKVADSEKFYAWAPLGTAVTVVD
jgi:lipoprotein-anchoring transpeptidase ErfK/SrfK